MAKIAPSAAQSVQLQIPKTAGGKGVPLLATVTVILARWLWSRISGGMVIIETMVCHRSLAINTLSLLIEV